MKEQIYSSDEESEFGSDGESNGASREDRTRKLREAEELGVTRRVYLNPRSFRPERMLFVHADQIANNKRDGYRRGITTTTTTTAAITSSSSTGSLWSSSLRLALGLMLYLFSVGQVSPCTLLFVYASIFAPVSANIHRVHKKTRRGPASMLVNG